MQQCSASVQLAATNGAAASNGVAADGSVVHTLRTSARLTLWKRAAMADCAAAERAQTDANGVQAAVMLGLRPGHLSTKQRTENSTRAASAASRRIGSLTNGLL